MVDGKTQQGFPLRKASERPTGRPVFSCLRGGQGRTARELEELAGEFGVIGGLTLTAVLVWLVTILSEFLHVH